MWLYHLAPDVALPAIKANGLKSAYSRTGKKEASPDGAFAKNRNKLIAIRTRQKLGTYITELLMNKVSREDITTTNPHYFPFSIAYTDSINDNETVDEREKEKLEEYKKAIKNSSEDPAIKDIKPKKIGAKLSAMTVKNFAPFSTFADTKAADQSHYLTKLATQYWQSRFNVEERITATNVYFFAEDNAEGFYKDYAKHLEGSSTVLRVNKNSLSNPDKLERDNSEARGFMTQEDVKPGIIQKLKAGKDFAQKAVRENDANWEPL